MIDDPTDILAQNDRKAELDELNRQEAILARNNIEWLMSTREGRRFMWGLLDRAGVYRVSGACDNTAFFINGERNVGAYYLTMISQHCEAEYALMLKEQKEDARHRQEQRRGN